MCQKYVDSETHHCYIQPERTRVRSAETAESDDLFDSEAGETNDNDSSYNQLLFLSLQVS